MGKVTKEESLVSFQTNARGKVEEVLFILNWVTLTTSADIELLRKVKSKNSVVVNLT